MVFLGCSNHSSPEIYKNTEGVSIETIKSLTTGRVWMAKNLGAKRICKSHDDKKCFGYYYQFGREADGHENPNSKTTKKVSYILSPNHNYFIVSSKENNYDWFPSDNLTNDRNGKWNICPKGFRVPKARELEAEKISDYQDAFQKLKMPSSNYRNYQGVFIEDELSEYTARYWSIPYDYLYDFKLKRLLSIDDKMITREEEYNLAHLLNDKASTIASSHIKTNSIALSFTYFGSGVDYIEPANGFSVRCIKASY